MKYSIFTISTMLLLSGCISQKPQPAPKPTMVKEEPTIQKHTPPKKEIELKEVEDNNYTDAYMYPQGTEKKDNAVQTPVDTIAAADTMSKQECIAMISREKFDKYTAMLGSEEASIKRCSMIRSMQ